MLPVREVALLTGDLPQNHAANAIITVHHWEGVTSRGGGRGQRGETKSEGEGVKTLGQDKSDDVMLGAVGYVKERQNTSVNFLGCNFPMNH